MLASGKKGRHSDDSHVYDQQMQKAAAKTRLWKACICDGGMDKQENRADRFGFWKVTGRIWFYETINRLSVMGRRFFHGEKYAGADGTRSDSYKREVIKKGGVRFNRRI